MVDISELEECDPAFSLTPLHVIREQLNRIFGYDKWIDWEPETFAIELGFLPDALLHDKIHALQLLATQPDLVHEDVMFFLALAEVMSNHTVDFEGMPMPNALQLALVVHEFPGEYSDDVKKTIGYLLNEDGYSQLLWPFTEQNADSSLLVNKECEGDDDREKANQEYIREMAA